MSSPVLWLPGLCPSPAPEGEAKAQRGGGIVRLETAMRLDAMTRAILNHNDPPFPNSWTYTTRGRFANGPRIPATQCRRETLS